jgi:Tfp pilus assembly protein PilO
MKLTGGVSIRAGGRIAWMLAATVFLGGGIGMVWWPASQTIAAIRSQAKTLYDETNENEAEVRHAAQLRALGKQVAEDVRALSGQGSQSALTARILGLLNREARAFKIDVRSIVPTPSTTPARDEDRVLVGAPIEIDARGQFRDLLAFVSDLPRHDALIALSDMTLDDSDDPSFKPQLNAKIHATVFRYRGFAEEGTPHASGPL